MVRSKNQKAVWTTSQRGGDVAEFYRHKTELLNIIRNTGPADANGILSVLREAKRALHHVSTEIKLQCALKSIKDDSRRGKMKKAVSAVLILISFLGAVNTFGAEPAKYHEIEIQRGMTWSELASAYGKTEEEIRKLNNFRDLVAGQKLTTPFHSDAYVAELEKEKEGWDKKESELDGRIEMLAGEVVTLNKSNFFHYWVLPVILGIGTLGFIISLVVWWVNHPTNRKKVVSGTLPTRKDYFYGQEKTSSGFFRQKT